MVTVILVSLGVVYLLMSGCFFTKWLDFFMKDYSNLSPQDKCLSWVFLVIATLLWLLVVPVAYLELLSKQKNVQVVDLHDHNS